MEELLRLGEERDCVIAVIVRNGRLLAGLRHYTPEKWKAISVWTLPGGRCEPGETLEAALRREVREEIGASEFRVTGFIGSVPGVKEGDVVHLFLAEIGEEPRNMEPSKFERLSWIALEEMPLNFINPDALAAIRNRLAQPVPVPPKPLAKGD